MRQSLISLPFGYTFVTSTKAADNPELSVESCFVFIYMYSIYLHRYIVLHRLPLKCNVANALHAPMLLHEHIYLQQQNVYSLRRVVSRNVIFIFIERTLHTHTHTHTEMQLHLISSDLFFFAWHFFFYFYVDAYDIRCRSTIRA